MLLSLVIAQILLLCLVKNTHIKKGNFASSVKACKIPQIKYSRGTIIFHFQHDGV